MYRLPAVMSYIPGSSTLRIPPDLFCGGPALRGQACYRTKRLKSCASPPAGRSHSLIIHALCMYVPASALTPPHYFFCELSEKIGIIVCNNDGTEVFGTEK